MKANSCSEKSSSKKNEIFSAIQNTHAVDIVNKINYNLVGFLNDESLHDAIKKCCELSFPLWEDIELSLSVAQFVSVVSMFLVEFYGNISSRRKYFPLINDAEDIFRP